MQTATFVTSTTNPDDLVKLSRPQIAMVGRSNVGKSSLINHLTGQKALARVSSGPGRTKTINLYEIDRRFFLVDLPGYGYAKASHEKRAGFATMIERYLTDTPQLILVLVVIDAFVGPTEHDHDMLELLHSLGKRVIIIVNKIDKLKKPEVEALMRALATDYPDTTFLAHSVKTDKYRGQILDAIDIAVRKEKAYAVGRES